MIVEAFPTLELVLPSLTVTSKSTLKYLFLGGTIVGAKGSAAFLLFDVVDSVDPGGEV